MEDKQIKTEYSIQQESSTYQTGSTKPPKSHMGLILVLLGIVIFLGGIVTALGVTNIRLFQALSAQQQTEPNAIGFSHADPQSVATNAKPTGLGFCGETVSEFWHTYHQMPLGVFIQTVDENSDAARKGVLPGDILIRLNGTPIIAIEDLQNLLEGTNGPVEIVLYRDNEQITLQIQPEK